MVLVNVNECASHGVRKLFCASFHRFPPFGCCCSGDCFDPAGQFECGASVCSDFSQDACTWAARCPFEPMAERERQLQGHGVGVAAEVACNHGRPLLWIPSAMLPRSPPTGRGGGEGLLVHQEKTGLSRNREKKTPPLRPSQSMGITGVSSRFWVGSVFSPLSHGQKHLSGAGLPQRSGERSEWRDKCVRGGLQVRAVVRKGGCPHSSCDASRGSAVGGAGERSEPPAAALIYY